MYSKLGRRITNREFEYDGIQHFQPIDYFGGIDNYKKVVYNDSIKNE